ncbi:MAG: hypoxanthine phosphoribosyltransferase [Acidimicrobiia bacterium]|nr:hypoxanthine phosphoribosyltransferase [Acidimicrobiia bacterium]MYA39361.1 hypoxanthine phosphoribosyltransferase [Acidimicrobiia bacterium]MYH06123.1 hypoxanthine phosphoribosyltransferase [Acidimicrobiia bacterium]MYJ15713.1 hypoxanthine phosphoribosyltransferase [Acidimicrobiia bacterium]MYK55699.1 hypoxanthine phosphoribosyltransferase [Acidimicrobiia bacterium]
MSDSERLFGPGTVSEVFTAEQISERVTELGRMLTERYRGRAPVMVGKMKGSVCFLADLVRHMDLEMEIEFLALKRYGDGSDVGIAMDLFTDIGGRDVIVVTDVVDTGFTLNTIRRLLRERSPASIATVALLDRKVRRLVETTLDYRGFEVGYDFLVGYGLDWDGRYRGLPSIWAVLDRLALETDPHILDRQVFAER